MTAQSTGPGHTQTAHQQKEKEKRKAQKAKWKKEEADCSEFMESVWENR